ncbi:MAG: aldehyde dehydrogenase family protein [Ilumatobacter sp.]|uniref:aldehyde dehydrogenase family protein n=1 Tax=Ilumatobacter sp. TaxID=1967498 RepID=UPI003750F3F6|nr:aldehyde dehydrogenase family protein [Ilumatobacter sp.]
MTSVDHIPEIVQELRAGFRAGAPNDVTSRRTQLRRLRALFVEQEDRILDALATDVGKPRIEAYTSEIAFTINEIDHTLQHLNAWTKPKKIGVPITFKPGKAMLRPEPLGTVCIIAPWNYPVQLLFAPLIPALAAGNTAVLKPSEVAPSVAALVEELVPKYFDSSTVAVVTGAVEQTTALLKERFEHIFYTGNGQVGRIVMRAAAEHLTPVTLELGGKSPAIVLADANIDVAAKRIAWAKFLNAGQTCVAPDYVLVEEKIEDQFLTALTDAVTTFYGDDPQQSADYARIVNERHHDRLMKLLSDGGYEATVFGGTGDRKTRYVAPTALTGVKADAAVMADEIFGPILPVLAIGDVDEAIRFVNDREKPLALYAFSSDDDTLEHVVANTSAGGVTLNHAVLHLAVPDLPFGGVGESGIGAYHGKSGFDTFSHFKPVLDKPTRPDPALMYPPYNANKQKIIRKFM